MKPTSTINAGNAGSLVPHLEAWAQEEIGAHKKLLELLRKQEQALLGRDAAAVEQATAELDLELDARRAREQRREVLLARSAGAFDVSRDALTLSGIAERLGPAGARLARMRGELLALAEDVRALARRLSTLARYNRSVLQEVIGVLLGGYERAVENGGCLVDSEA